MPVNNKVIVIGALNYDVCLKLKKLPEEGETNFADSVEYCSGGKGGNQAVQAAKLGLRTCMFGCIGNDLSGAFLKENLEHFGVDTAYLRVIDGSSGMSVAQSLYDGGVRASVVRGANGAVDQTDVDAAAGIMEAGDIVVLQLEIPVSVAEYAICKAKEKGGYVILNAAPAAPVSEEVLKKVDLLIVNEVEAGFYAGCKIDSVGRAELEIHRMAERCGGSCIVTLGKAGSVLRTDGKSLHIPSKQVKAVESTGAGDSYIGGICWALLNGMDLFHAAAFATCCSAKTVCRTGGQPAMPSLSEAMAMYQKE